MNEMYKREDALLGRISALIDSARKRVKTAVDTTMVYTYFGVGHYIVEDEQQGKERAVYGKAILKNLSDRLAGKYGEGWSVETLNKCRKFYRIYSRYNISEIVHSVDEMTNIGYGVQNSVIDLREAEKEYVFRLSWSHYFVLMRIENPEARSFYEIESIQQQWSVRQLSRQVGSSLFA